MTTLKKIFFSLIIPVGLTSCGGTTHYLASGQYSKKDNYKINSYYGCCGCEAKYFIINSGKQKVEQVIYSDNCYNIGKPTKFIFNYNDRGKLISCDKLIATTSDDFTQTLNEQEKRIFSMLDTSILLKANYTTIKFSEIKGFRKPIDKEVTDSFPFIKKGYKVPIN